MMISQLSWLKDEKHHDMNIDRDVHADVCVKAHSL